MANSTKDPKADIFRIEELVTKVKDGDIKLPKFQRSFVWSKKDILRIFDSIYKGYPVGSILLWLTTEKLASEREIGDLQINQRDDIYPTNYLLDGQQRLSSLCGALYWQGSDKKNRWNVSFDLDNEVFIYAEDEFKPELFPLNKLLNTLDFLGQVKTFENHPKREKFNKNATRLLNSIKDYKIPAVMIGDMKIDEVAPIFERINSSGQLLTIVDLMRAATWSGGFDLNDAIQAVRTTLEKKYFDDVPEQHILRNISSSAGLGIHKEGIEKLRGKTSEELQKASNDSVVGYQLAVDFLTSELPLTSYGYLPYGLQLTLLVEFFRLCPKPDINKRKILKQWLWDTSFSNHFGRSNTGQQTSDLTMIRGFAKGEMLKLNIEENIAFQSLVKDDFRLNKASSKAFGMLLAENQPKSLFDGTPIDTGDVLNKVNKNEYHHIFPKEYLRSSGYAEKDINQHANICMLTMLDNKQISNSRPSLYFKDILKKLGDHTFEVLESNFISKEAYEAAINEDYTAFTRLRADLIISKMKTLVSSRQLKLPNQPDFEELQETLDIEGNETLFDQLVERASEEIE